MSLTDAIEAPRTEPAERETSGRRWLTAVAGVGAAVAMFLFSLYAPPAIRRALGKEPLE